MKDLRFLKTLPALQRQIPADYYKGSRQRSKSDHLILFDFLKEVYLYNHTCERAKRLTDDDIRQLVFQEFEDARFLDKSRRYTSVWRNLFNHDKLHNCSNEKRNFIAYRVNHVLQFTRSTSDYKFLTVDQLCDDYSEAGFDLPETLLKEVKGYPLE